jgi:O-antigen/teichoic acid export membrane protein
MILGPPIVKLLGLKGSFVGLEWMVQLLGLRAAMDIYCSPTGTVLFASGASRYSAMANVVRLVILVAGLFFTLKIWGLQGAFVALLGAPLIAYTALLPGIGKHMPGALRVEALTMVALLGGSALAAAAAWWISPIIMN